MGLALLVVPIFSHFDGNYDIELATKNTADWITRDMDQPRVQKLVVIGLCAFNAFLLRYCPRLLPFFFFLAVAPFSEVGPARVSLLWPPLSDSVSRIHLWVYLRVVDMFEPTFRKWIQNWVEVSVAVLKRWHWPLTIVFGHLTTWAHEQSRGVAILLMHRVGT